MHVHHCLTYTRLRVQECVVFKNYKHIQDNSDALSALYLASIFQFTCNLFSFLVFWVFFSISTENYYNSVIYFNICMLIHIVYQI